jgi:preprotein translocase subunit SecD
MKPSRALVFSVAFAGVVGTILAAQALRAAAKLEFRLAEKQPGKGLTETVVAGTKQKVYLHPEPMVTNKDIAQARLTTETGSEPAVFLKFTQTAGKKLAQATAGHLDRPLAVLLDGKVISAPRVKAKISGEAVLFVGSKAEAQRIVDAIKAK